MSRETAGSAWVGGAVRLRAVEADDWELFFSMDQDDDLARRLDRVHFPRSREAARRWAEQEAARKPEGDDFRFVIQDETGSAIGSISTHFCDHRNGTFYYGVALLQAARGKGYAREAITLMLRYYFAELRYQKAMAVIYSFNEASIRLHEGLGFQHEGRLRRMGFTEGRYFDHLFYGITAEEFLAGASGSPPAAQ